MSDTPAMHYADLTAIRADEPTPTVLALCDAVEWMRDRLTMLNDAESMERFHQRTPAMSAREACVEAMAVALAEQDDKVLPRWHHIREARAALDALLSLEWNETCPTCSGRGTVPNGTGGWMTCFAENCCGGTVSKGLAIVTVTPQEETDP